MVIDELRLVERVGGKMRPNGVSGAGAIAGLKVLMYRVLRRIRECELTFKNTKKRSGVPGDIGRTCLGGVRGGGVRTLVHGGPAGDASVPVHLVQVEGGRVGVQERSEAVQCSCADSRRFGEDDGKQLQKDTKKK